MEDENLDGESEGQFDPEMDPFTPGAKKKPKGLGDDELDLGNDSLDAMADEENTVLPEDDMDDRNPEDLMM